LYSALLLAEKSHHEKFPHWKNIGKEITHKNTQKYPDARRKKVDDDSDIESIYAQKILDSVDGSNKKEIERLDHESPQKLRLILDSDIREFGQDLIDLLRRIAFESKIIDQTHLFGEATTSHVSQADIDEFGGDFVFLARRVMEDVKRKAGRSDSNERYFIKPNTEDDEKWGVDMLDIFYKVAQEEFNVTVDTARHSTIIKYLAKKCPFCGGSIVRSSRICEGCGTGFSMDPSKKYLMRINLHYLARQTCMFI